MIPPHARRVFEGELFDIYQWDQELYDGSTAVFERAKRKAQTVQIIASTPAGQIIVIDEDQPGSRRDSSVPGGRVDKGEDPLEAARRELLEETGYEPAAIEHWRTYDRFPKLEWEVHYYIARGCVRVRDPSPDAGERIAVRTVSFEDFIETATSRDEGSFTADLLRMRLDPEKLDAFKNELASFSPNE